MHESTQKTDPHARWACARMLPEASVIGGNACSHACTHAQRTKVRRFHQTGVRRFDCRRFVYARNGRSVDAKKYPTVIMLRIVAERNLFFPVTLPLVVLFSCVDPKAFTCAVDWRSEVYQ